MISFLIVVIGVIIAYSMGHRTGWVNAHAEVAKECKLLGRFYVGDEVFKAELERTIDQAG